MKLDLALFSILNNCPDIQESETLLRMAWKLVSIMILLDLKLE